MPKLVTENSLKELQIPELIPVSRFNDFSLILVSAH